MVTRTHFPIAFIAAAIALTFLFWWPLYGGAGFIGGDLYPYFFPQKAYYADRLKLGEFPLWNDLTGFGYPVLGESQTGAAYPFHLIFYSLLDLNTAYNAEHLLHYLICYVATALFARRLGLSETGSALAALVFTYGWFPPRACLEWAILTGAWMPLALWCVESFLQTRWWRYAIGLSLTLGMQLLAGHYHLAFITQLVVATYICTRLWIEQRQRRMGLCPGNGHCGKRAFVALALAGIAGICLASVQLLPTWELKQRSSRVVAGSDYDPAYGHMPPLYVSQLFIPWCWYSPHSIDEDNIVRELAEFTAPWHWFGPQQDLDEMIQKNRLGALTAGTNKVEAHVYCGMIPIAIALLAVVGWWRNRPNGKTPDSVSNLMSATTGFWLIAAILSLIYATGWLLPIGRHLPGFSFFRGPGRYGIVATLTIALLAGQWVTHYSFRISNRSQRILILILVFVSTCGDLWLVSRMVKYSYIVSRPAISFRHESIVAQRLKQEESMPRLLAPGPNVGNLLNVSCVPWYLGMAPEEYVDPRFAMPPIPKPSPDGKPTPGSVELLQWLSQSGVTHILNFEPLEETTWQVDLMWKGIDPFLNRVWGRTEQIYLYRFHPIADSSNEISFPGRAYTTDLSTRVVPLDGKQRKSESRLIVVEPDGSKESTLVLTELAFPGWTVTRNKEAWETKTTGLFRTVRCPAEGGEFQWTYRPASVIYGSIISIATLFLLAAIGHIRFWHPHLTEWSRKASETESSK